MLQDVPYSELKKNERAYEIMLLRDQHGNAFTDIAKEYGISHERTRQQYSKIKFRQSRLYINHIATTLGYDDASEIQKVFDAAMACYETWPHACAYLEVQYKGILDEYRAGEPGMPAQFIKKMPPFKPELSTRAVASVIRMREVENTPFTEIAKKLRITQEKAEHVYQSYYHKKVLACIDALYEKAQGRGSKQAIQQRIFSGNMTSKKRYERLLQEYPELSGK